MQRVPDSAFLAFLIFFSSTALLQINPARAGEAEGRFRYDAKLGKCVDERGEEGLNPPARNHENNECADYRGKLVMYLRGDGGNFRGANFDGAQFRYLNSMKRADLTGAKLTNILADMLDLAGTNLSAADLSGARLKKCEDPGGACLAGARFDAKTILPFSREEALARGMAAAEENRSHDDVGSQPKKR